MLQPSVVILGGGISGLALGYFLKKKIGSSFPVKIIEGQSRLGGWIQTIEKEGFLFEQGPRSCRSQGTGKETLQLIKDLDLSGDLVPCNPAASKRFLWKDQKLQPLRSCFFSFSQLTLLFQSLWRDFFTATGTGQDESIDAFVRRRLGNEIAESMIDPLVSGIYAGDSRRLSIRSCFPLLFDWEQKHGSLIKGFLANWKLRKEKEKFPLFSFKKGMETVIKSLECNFLKLGGEIITSTPVTRLSFKENNIVLSLAEKKEEIVADYLFSTIAAESLAAILPKEMMALNKLLNLIPSSSIISINFGYRKNLLKKNGFGYLIPTKEKEQILGVIWDSSVLPQQNGSPEETRLTVMMGGEHHLKLLEMPESKWVEIALESIKRHLGIDQKPDLYAIKIARKAIPQYYVGHKDILNKIEQEVKKISQCFTLLGSSFYGVSLNDCIARAKYEAEIFHKNFEV